MKSLDKFQTVATNARFYKRRWHFSLARSRAALIPKGSPLICSPGRHACALERPASHSAVPTFSRSTPHHRWNDDRCPQELIHFQIAGNHQDAYITSTPRAHSRPLRGMEYRRSHAVLEIDGWVHSSSSFTPIGASPGRSASWRKPCPTRQRRACFTFEDKSWRISRA